VTHIPAAVIVLAILCTRLALAEEIGRVKISGGWAGLGVGANRGDGVPTCGELEYPFSLTALRHSRSATSAPPGSGFRHGSRTQPRG
jgi:hypothetical protein